LKTENNLKILEFLRLKEKIKKLKLQTISRLV